MKNKYLLTVKYALASIALGIFGLIGAFAINEAPVSAAGAEVVLSVTIVAPVVDLEVLLPADGNVVGSSFDVQIRGSDISDVDLYVDFNGDGDYDDPGEYIGTYPINQSGQFGPQFIGPVIFPSWANPGDYDLKAVGNQLSNPGNKTDVELTVDYRDTNSVDGAPTITDVAPGFGPITGGTPITITGENFENGSDVYIGNNLCENVVVVNSTTITCTTPAGDAAERVDVTIVGPNGLYSDTRSNGGFVYHAVGSGGGGGGGNLAGLVPNTGLFRVGSGVVMSYDLIFIILLALIIALGLIIAKKDRDSKKVAAKKNTPARVSTARPRVRSKKYMAKKK